MDRSWRWISWLMLGIGGLIVAGGLALGYGSLKLVLYGEHAPGIVKQIVRNGDMYEPVFRFRLPGGKAPAMLSRSPTNRRGRSTPIS
ncbi:MAG TPA: hypothetical protein VKY24_04860 [Reyranella sp.]|nr:hypothetical protein [Reyranella sp.]